MPDTGEEAPSFTLQTTAGGTRSLSESIRNGPAVVLINRGVWCSYCAEQLMTFSVLHYDLTRNYSTSILPILADDISELRGMRDRFNFSFQLLSDPEFKVAEDWTGIEVTERHGFVPIAGTYVVDEEGIVQFKHISEDYADRPYANYIRQIIDNEFKKPYEDFSYTRRD